MKLCKDCKHFIDFKGKDNNKCSNFRIIFDPVYGGCYDVPPLIARRNEEMCGLGAKFFEPIEEKK